MGLSPSSHNSRLNETVFSKRFGGLAECGHFFFSFFVLFEANPKDSKIGHISNIKNVRLGTFIMIEDSRSVEQEMRFNV